MSYDYNSSDPIKIKLSNLEARERFLLSESKTFCMYPWIHLHAYPTGEAYPCCHAEMGVGQVGNCKTNTMTEIWNSPEQKKLRQDMLTETENSACGRCYEQEKSGFFSGRQSANKHHGHHIHRTQDTTVDGEYKDFEMTYWDIRFSNLCNLSCRSCGHIFSSSWYKDQTALAGPEWAKNNNVLNYAGRFKTDMMDQLMEHLDHVEQIYFAGGEPCMMDEHYVILEELERRGRFDVRLIYNTNFTHVQLKDRLVFDYWKKFDSVAVGASLDAMGPRAEYIRKGTKWAVVEENRRNMMEICPKVDFYISPTLSIMNALHIPEFHRDWVEKGLIRAQDLNVNILQDPDYYRIDIAPQAYKDQIIKSYQSHLEWLRPLDELNRATVGFESALQYLKTDNTRLLKKFWQKTNQLDSIRDEDMLDVIPELRGLLGYERIIYFPPCLGGNWLSSTIEGLVSDTLPTASGNVFDHDKSSSKILLTHYLDFEKWHPDPVVDKHTMFSSASPFVHFCLRCHKGYLNKDHGLYQQEVSLGKQILDLIDVGVYLLEDKIFTAYYKDIDIVYDHLFTDKERFAKTLFDTLVDHRLNNNYKFVYDSIEVYKKTAINPVDVIDTDSLIWLSWCLVILQVHNIHLQFDVLEVQSLAELSKNLQEYKHFCIEETHKMLKGWNIN